MIKTLCWVRRDLRLTDHPALEAATHGDRECYICFVFDSTILDRLESTDRRLTFIYGCLKEMQQKMQSFHSRMIIRTGDPVVEIPRLAAQLGIEEVHTNSDSEPYGKRRDKAVSRELGSMGVAFHSYKDHVIFSGEEIMNRQGKPYKVYTPYSRAWRDRLTPGDQLDHQPNLDHLANMEDMQSEFHFPSLRQIGFERQPLILEPGSSAAENQFHVFLNRLDDYHEKRDLPSVEGTSKLSVHLRFGTISIRHLVREVGSRQGEGPQVWLNELIWREFYHMILEAFPYVVDGSFKPEYDQVTWPGSDSHFQAWKEGRTGYPLVDAAMRHFSKTGWMHNRLRMVTAAFLVKDLLVDWRLGEAYFAQHLLDFELASNNGGWQWCASTGVDAMPWFRVFNPTNQAKKFDPEGVYIRTHLPERRSMLHATIHQPIDPIVDHRIQVEKFKQLFQGVKSK